MATRVPEEWVALGKEAILELLDGEHAAHNLEIEARIADSTWPGIDAHVEPKPLHQALTALHHEGRIEAEEKTPTRGGRPVSVWIPTGGRRRTAIDKAAARKRLLMARYLGWAQGTPSRAGVIGPAGERVVHASLQQAAAHGFRLARPQGGDVTEFLGQELAMGSLDNAAILTQLVNGLPGSSIAIPVEVKNLRDWIYPSSQELYQLLEKAAFLQQQCPQMLMVPVLICRRAHITAFRMASDLGFFIIDTQRQYIAGVEEDKLTELRRELGFLDLALHHDADERVVRRFTRTFPTNADDRAERWAITATDHRFRELFAVSRTSGHAPERSRNVEIVRELARENGLYRTEGW